MVRELVSTPAPPAGPTQLYTQLGRRELVSTATAPESGPLRRLSVGTLTPWEFTDRQGDELLSFIVERLDDDEERAMFHEDLRRAVVDALKSNSLLPVAQLLGDWEATVEIKLDPQLSQELHEALEDVHSQRRGSAG